MIEYAQNYSGITHEQYFHSWNDAHSTPAPGTR